MKYRRFANTGLFVSELSLGTMTFGGRGFWEVMGKLDQAESEVLVGTALDAGVNLIDTADRYADGESERIVGAALRALARPREQVLVATKVKGRVGPGVNQVGLSRGHILTAIDASLRRLGLDYVDLYQTHGADPETPIEETMRALDDVVRSGKARYVGFCNLPAWQAMKANAFARAEGLHRFVSAQMYYSLVGRDIEREIVPLANDQQLAILPWSPLAGGLLTGKFDLEQDDRAAPKGARRTTFDFPPVDRAKGIRVLAALRVVAQQTGLSVARISLAWLLSRPHVTSVIVGARTRDQLVDNLAASEVALDREHLALLDNASALEPEYPSWMIDWQNRDRLPPSI